MPFKKKCLYGAYIEAIVQCSSQCTSPKPPLHHLKKSVTLWNQYDCLYILGYYRNMAGEQYCLTLEFLEILFLLFPLMLPH